MFSPPGFKILFKATLVFCQLCLLNAYLQPIKAQTIVQSDLLLITAPSNSAGTMYLVSPNLNGKGFSLLDSWQEPLPELGMESPRFGFELVAADFNADGKIDVAVSSPEDSQVRFRAGRVQVFYNVADGFAAPQGFDQEGLGSLGQTEAGDAFGRALAVADFNQDGFDDLAVGASGESHGLGDAGAVSILYGSSEGLTRYRAITFIQGVNGVEGKSDEENSLGFSLLATDLNADGFADLVAGLPFRESTQGPEGAIHVFWGSSEGLTAKDDQVITQDSLGIPRKGEFFGYSLAVARWDDSGPSTLLVGIPGEHGGQLALLSVMPDKQIDLKKIISQEHLGLTAEKDDAFASSLTIADLNADAFSDVVIGISSKKLKGVSFAGSVVVAYGSSAGLSHAGSQFLSQGERLKGQLILDEAEPYDSYGRTLAVADLNADTIDDLVIGIPFEDTTFEDTGAISILYGSKEGLAGKDNHFISQKDLAITPVNNALFGWAIITLP